MLNPELFEYYACIEFAAHRQYINKVARVMFNWPNTLILYPINFLFIWLFLCLIYSVSLGLG